MKHYGIENIGTIISDILSITALTELTISSHAVTITQSVHSIDTELDAATDDLTTINGSTDGRIILLRAADASRIITIKETGNISCGGSNITLSTTKYLPFYYDTTLTKWILFGGGGGSSTDFLVVQVFS